MPVIWCFKSTDLYIKCTVCSATVWPIISAMVTGTVKIMLQTLLVSSSVYSERNMKTVCGHDDRLHICIRTIHCDNQTLPYTEDAVFVRFVLRSCFLVL